MCVETYGDPASETIPLRLLSNFTQKRDQKF